MRIGLLGGLRVEHDGRDISPTGAMQLSVLFRLAVDAGTSVSYRAIAEDIWGLDAPENTRASLQSIVSRLRSQLPPGVIESTAGGYRLVVSRDDVDALRFTDLVAAAMKTPGDASRLASEALNCWNGEPWLPSERFDWFARDLHTDRATAIELGGVSPGPTAAARRLPAPLSSLVGRSVELAMISDQLASSRLVTVVGTGGAGKTRLALEAASRQPAALVVELAPVGPSEVMAAVQSATGRDIRSVDVAPESSSPRERVLEALFARDILLVLDNCEHVIDEVARVAEDLLESLPSLRILATSREPLAIPGEAFVAVGSLPHPGDPDKLDTEAVLEYPAVELFRQRASAARGHDLSADEVSTVARITARLDGLPLALELAAAKLRTMSPDEVLDGLENRFTLLTGGYRTALPRHQTLRAMIDWSWSLLSEDERLVLARLAVFPSGVDSGDAVELAVLMGLPSASVFESLVDKSLLQRSRGRYRTLETVREYGLERLADSADTANAREVQARHEADRASHFDRLLRGPRINEAIAWFDAEEDNLSAAIRYATTAPLPETAVRLGVACAWYWTVRDRGEDSAQWFPLIADLARGVEGQEAELVALIGPVMLAFSGSGETEIEPTAAVERSMELLAPVVEMTLDSDSHDLLQLLPPAIAAFGKVMGQPDWMTKVRLPVGEDIGLGVWPCAVLRVMRAAMAHNRGDVEELGIESALAIEQFTAIGDLWGLSLAQQMRGLWLMMQGRLEEALQVSDESTGNMRRITTDEDLAQQQGLAISILVRQERYDEASERVNAIIEEARRGGNTRVELQAQLSAVGIDVRQGDIASAGSRISLLEELALGWHHFPIQLRAAIEGSKAQLDILRHDHEAATTHLRTALDAAITSHDHPVIGMVAITIGVLALDRGDVAAAVRAIDLATAVSGAYDATNPDVIAIDTAAIEARIGRPGTEVRDRPMAIEALRNFF